MYWSQYFHSASQPQIFCFISSWHLLAIEGEWFHFTGVLQVGKQTKSRNNLSEIMQGFAGRAAVSASSHLSEGPAILHLGYSDRNPQNFLLPETHC